MTGSRVKPGRGTAIAATATGAAAATVSVVRDARKAHKKGEKLDAKKTAKRAAAAGLAGLVVGAGAELGSQTQFVQGKLGALKNALRGTGASEAPLTNGLSDPVAGSRQVVAKAASAAVHELPELVDASGVRDLLDLSPPTKVIEGMGSTPKPEAVLHRLRDTFSGHWDAATTGADASNAAAREKLAAWGREVAPKLCGSGPELSVKLSEDGALAAARLALMRDYFEQLRLPDDSPVWERLVHTVADGFRYWKGSYLPSAAS